MKVDDVYLKTLLTIVILCLALVTISYLTKQRTIAEASVKRNIAGFTGPPLLAKA